MRDDETIPVAGADDATLHAATATAPTLAAVTGSDIDAAPEVCDWF